MTGDEQHSTAAAHRSRLVAVFALTGSFFLVELVGGLLANSLALIADAGHMLTDVIGIGFALGAIWFAGRPANESRTFGFLRLEILAAVVNAVLLFGVAGYVLFEAWQRLSSPLEVASGLMLGVAIVGLLVNAISLYLLRRVQKQSLNMRGAYIEVMGDFAGSLAVIFAAIVIGLTGWREADSAAAALIGLLIIPRTWSLLREAIDILLEATPKGVDLKEVREHLLKAPGVVDIHDLHAWTITSGMNVVSAHIVLGDRASAPAVLDELCQCLSGDFDIEHSTFQLESADRRRLEDRAHA